MSRSSFNPLSRNMVISIAAVSVLYVILFLALTDYSSTFGRNAVILILTMVPAIFAILLFFVRRINKIIGDQANEENAQIRRDLTQNIAHELKTPVASIQGYLETILDEPDMDEETKRQFLDRSFVQTKRLTSLLQDISTLNKMDAKTPTYRIEPVDICKMVDGIARETALQRENAEMTFKSRLVPPIIIKGDYSLLYGIFRNLMDNAIAYAGPGTHITISASRGEDSWFFVFRDNGTGVPPEHLDHLFERFYRVDKGRSRKLGGTGLGLAIVKNAVMIHGGDIVAKNNEDGGLRFDFSLRVDNFKPKPDKKSRKRQKSKA